MRVGFVGDVHGHERELIAMLGQLEEHGCDEIVSLGDVLDRGPHSIPCLRVMRDWNFTNRDGAAASFQMILGNHEDAYLRAIDRRPKPGRSGVSPREESGVARSLRPPDIEFMRSLPVSLRFPEIDVTALHGGVTPHAEEIDDYALRVRYLDDRHYDLRGTRSSETFWADVYDGRFGLAVFGHESHQEPSLYENALALDGEGFRRLHAAVISDEPWDDWLTCYTLNYGNERVREVAPAANPVRFHDSRSWRREYLLEPQRRLF